MWLIYRGITTIATIWRENMHGYFSADVIYAEMRTVLRQRSSKKTVSFKEEVKSKEKYTSISSRQMEAIVFIILQIFLKHADKLFTKNLLFDKRNVYFFSVLWYDFKNKQICPFFFDNSETLFHLELNYKRTLSSA